ncbi:hydrogenase/urease maturation nickel metallochaperone HypA [Clostridium yunnanense]|uniref:hydrogenase/urease maturation nickel metallochaperone HypA n=1 Tax=Clostridium yunnanense TaxID=2800325 RepID=UPI001A9C89D8
MREVHEASIAYEIFLIIEESVRKYNLEKVNLIVLSIGGYNGIFEESLKFAFTAISKGTKCEEAELIITKTEGFEMVVERIEGE